jgi:endonuclease III
VAQRKSVKRPARAIRPRRAKVTPPEPDRTHVRAIRDQLRSFYGRPRNEPHGAPLDELILTVLSQNTNDRNRDVAYARLRARFPRSETDSRSPDWAAVAVAPVEAVEEAIRPGGISNVKSRRMQAMLGAIAAETGSLELGMLADLPRERAIEFLERLPGVGRKTTACVLLFAFDRPELPVDTHVYRVSSRLGLIREKASFVEAHEVLLAATDPEDVYELHVNLIRHGRRLCTARSPQCDRCPLLELCPFGRRRMGRGDGSAT